MFQNGPLTIKLTCSASFFVKNESAIRKRHPLKGMDKNLRVQNQEVLKMGI